MTEYKITLPDGTVVEGPTAESTVEMAQEMQEGPTQDFPLDWSIGFEPREATDDTTEWEIDDLEDSELYRAIKKDVHNDWTNRYRRGIPF